MLRDRITEIGEYKLEYSSLDELAEQIKVIFPQIEDKIFHQMAELIQSDLLPKYRMD